MNIYDFINSFANGDPKMFAVIEGAMFIILFHLIWVIYILIQKLRKSYDKPIERILYYRTFTFVMCICLGLIIGT